MLGTPLMEWQQYVADVLLELDPDTGELVYTDWTLTVPRQSGKSTLILAKASHRCSATGFFGAGQHIAYTAQTQKKATEKFEVDYLAAIRRAPRLKAKVRTGNVKVDIRYPNGSVFAVESTTEKSGHGSVLDEGFIDEAFSQVDNRSEQAMEPAMVTRHNRQLGAVSTAGWLDASPYLLGKVQTGRALIQRGVVRGTAYFEWSAPEDADAADESVWLACMPAVHRPDCPRDCKRHTIRLSAIRALYEKAVRENKVSDFCRAYLNQWKRKPREGEETALGNWAACGVDVREDALPPVAAIGVGMARDRETAAIGLAMLTELTRAGDEILPDGLPLLAPVAYRAGVDWLAGEAARISQERGIPVVVDVKTKVDGKPLADVIEELGGIVERVDLEGYVAACADIYDRVHGRRVFHTNAQVLNDSVLGVRWRPVGDGRRVFGRRVSESDSSMTEAVTLALWGATNTPAYDVMDSAW